MSGEIRLIQTTGLVPDTRTVNGHALSSNVTVTKSDVGLSNVTNDIQTKAAIVPNTAPSSAQILVGNGGGTAYAPQTMGGDGSLDNSGNFTIANSALNINDNLDNAPISTNTWRKIGYINNPTVTADARMLVEVFSDQGTTSLMSRVQVEVTVNNSGGSFKVTPTILEGRISSIRPRFQLYQDNTSPNNWFLYVQLKTGTRSAIYFYKYAKLNAVNDPAAAGTGASPTGVGGMTLKYDTDTDEAGLFSPKSVSATAPFWSPSPTFNLSFSKAGNQLTAYFDMLSQNITSASAGVITLASGTIPTKYTCNNLINTVIGGIEAGGPQLCWVRINTDGSAIISKISGFSNLTSNLSAVIGNPNGWESFSLSWVMDNN